MKIFGAVRHLEISYAILNYVIRITKYEKKKTNIMTENFIENIYNFVVSAVTADA